MCPEWTEIWWRRRQSGANQALLQHRNRESLRFRWPNCRLNAENAVPMGLLRPATPNLEQGISAQTTGNPTVQNRELAVPCQYISVRIVAYELASALLVGAARP